MLQVALYPLFVENSVIVRDGLTPAPAAGGDLAPAPTPGGGMAPHRVPVMVWHQHRLLVVAQHRQPVLVVNWWFGPQASGANAH